MSSNSDERKLPFGREATERLDKDVREFIKRASEPYNFAADHIYKNIKAAGEKRWNEATLRWETHLGEAVAPPTQDELRGVALDNIVNHLHNITPELMGLLVAYRERTISLFVKELVEQLKEDDTKALVDAGRKLVALVLETANHSVEMKHRSSFDWQIDIVVKQMIHDQLRAMVREELGKVKDLQALVANVVQEAVKSEKLSLEAQNHITPKMLELIGNLRLEMSAGPPKPRY